MIHPVNENFPKFNTVYNFDYVPVEVRSFHDPYTVWTKMEYQKVGKVKLKKL